MILSVNGINKAFGIQQVLKDVSLMVEDKEKCALVGVNGAGKTTLFHIITGALAPDAGQIVLQKGASVGTLSQQLDLNPNHTVQEEMLEVFQEVITLEADMRKLEADMAGLSGEALQATLAKYDKMQHSFEALGGYAYKSQLRGVIKGLGFAEEDSAQPIGTFSGGQKTRLAMAKLLLKAPDLLLLDEPTNHLDIASVQWLEEFLKNYAGAVLVISHDRYFLDRVATKVIEIEHGGAKSYNGNYSEFAHKKEIDRQLAQKHYADQQKEIKRQEEVIRTLKSYNREKSIKRAESREKQLAKIERVEKPAPLPEVMRLALAPQRPSGQEVLAVSELAKDFDGTPLFNGVNFTIYKGERVALVGPNGVGKTTLLRMILGQAAVSSGHVRLGHHVTIGLYDQEHQNLNLNHTIFQEMVNACPGFTVGRLRNALAAFMFTGDDINKPIAALSGGERGRVALCKIMLGNANFLLLDEPTNHLDIFSKEVLENALASYTGTILTISHDRYFMNRVATKMVALSPTGVTVTLGDYDDMVERSREEAVVAPVVDAPEEAEFASENKNKWLQNKEQQAQRRKQQSALNTAKKRMAQAEKTLEELESKLLDPSLSTNPGALADLYEEKVALEEELLNLYEQCESLENDLNGQPQI